MPRRSHFRSVASAGIISLRLSISGGLVIEQDDPLPFEDPDGTAIGTLEEVFRISVGMHIEFHASGGVAKRTGHSWFPFDTDFS